MQEAWKFSNRMILDSMIDKGISIKKAFNPCYIARTTACYIDERYDYQRGTLRISKTTIHKHVAEKHNLY